MWYNKNICWYIIYWKNDIPFLEPVMPVFNLVIWYSRIISVYVWLPKIWNLYLNKIYEYNEGKYLKLFEQMNLFKTIMDINMFFSKKHINNLKICSTFNLIILESL